VCADELVVGGGVGWSYDRRRTANFSSAAEAWLYGRRRRRRRQTGWESTETAHSLHAVHNFTVVMSFWRLI